MEVDYEKTIRHLKLSQIQENPVNPRRRFDELEDDKLLDSVAQKGILSPLVVYHDGNNRYILLDGSRRFRCAKKLNLESVPAYVLKNTPSKLENLSLMFHIHYARQQWSDLATAIALRLLISELGTKDNKVLSQYTSLPIYKINKYKRLFAFKDETLNQFLANEKSSEEKLDSDLLVELSLPLRIIQKSFPELAKEISPEFAVKSLIKKKKHGKIENNAELRKITKILKTPESAGVSHTDIASSVLEFFKNPNLSAEDIFERTSSIYYETEKVTREIELVSSRISDISLKRMSLDKRVELVKKLRDLVSLIERKIGSK